MIQQDVQHGDLIPLLVELALPVAMPINAVYDSEQYVSNRLCCFIDFIKKRLTQTMTTK
nr:hypothetical protein [Yersinia aleksiciae]